MHMHDLKEQDYIGFTVITLSELCTNKDRTLVKPLSAPGKNSSRGYIIIEAEEITEFNFDVVMRWNGRDIERTTFFSLPDPFLVFSRAKEGGSWTVVHKTENCVKTANPDWHPFSVSAQLLSNGDMKRPLLVECWDYNRNGIHSLVGSFVTSLEELKKYPNGHQFTLKNNQTKKIVGHLNLIKFDMIKQSSFLEYILGGCQINLVIGIDFTASNGHPSQPSSLHYHGNARNEYVQAITSVCEVLAAYDSDLLFPVFGFGAKIPPHNHVSHCFPLTWDPNRPEVHMVSGILNAYREALSRVQLSGPTIFSELLKTVRGLSPHSIQDEQSYTILLILTDGVINDMQDTINEIVKLSSLPVSIVIVGVGNANFSNMDTLDADTEPLRSSSGEVMQRDIVQFVPFSKYRNNPTKLAVELLDEIPRQLLDYMKSRKITPNPPVGLVQVFKNPACDGVDCGGTGPGGGGGSVGVGTATTTFHVPPEITNPVGYPYAKGGPQGGDPFSSVPTHQQYPYQMTVPFPDPFATSNGVYATRTMGPGPQSQQLPGPYPLGQYTSYRAQPLGQPEAQQLQTSPYPSPPGPYPGQPSVYQGPLGGPYPSGPYPGQPSPYPGQLGVPPHGQPGPYPGQLGVSPHGQPGPYPGQPGVPPHGQPAPYPGQPRVPPHGQPGPYLGQPGVPHPDQAGPYPGQLGPYPGKLGSPPTGQPGPYPGQPGPSPPPGQPGPYPGQPGPSPPPGQPGHYNVQPGLYSGQPGAPPPGQPGSYLGQPGQLGAYPGQPDGHPPGGQLDGHPPGGQPGTYPPGVYPGQPGAYPPGTYPGQPDGHPPVVQQGVQPDTHPGQPGGQPGVHSGAWSS
eukprot:TRINITY_DN1143_c0_g2_i12.p1 TRINITY_DN1143_c0_g2~~TRINITY_DN1143_c0_g2_i12.p1  ORF type:complete len:846 (-),score=168.77 TRINITY_DN1143_c0_g2_i12:199-2736(-)